MKIFCFGNEFWKEDSAAKELASFLIFRGFDVVLAHSPDVLFDETEAIIIDVAKGISEPAIITDLGKLKTQGVVSTHDFDLAHYVKMLSQVKNFRAKIIAIPWDANPEKIKQKVLGLLEKIQTK